MHYHVIEWSNISLGRRNRLNPNTFYLYGQNRLNATSVIYYSGLSVFVDYIGVEFSTETRTRTFGQALDWIETQEEKDKQRRR